MECLECGLGYVTVVGEDGFKLYLSCAQVVSQLWEGYT